MARKKLGCSRRRHLAAVDEWLAKLEHEYGLVPPGSESWAAKLLAE